MHEKCLESVYGSKLVRKWLDYLSVMQIGIEMHNYEGSLQQINKILNNR